MIEISIENVKRITVWLKPELLSRMDGWLETAKCKNRSEFISKALRFYMGYLATDDVSSYVCESVSQNIRGMLTENTNRISKLMFKWSVELNMMMHIVAAHFKDDVSDLRALRGYSADEVKRTYPMLSTGNCVLLSAATLVTDGRCVFLFAISQRWKAIGKARKSH